MTPLGELVAVPDREALVYGNRGCLHDESGRIRRHHNGRRWIACRLKFENRHRSPLMQPGRYTELFFLDDATALAAGHRACRECRYEDYQRLADLFGQKAAEIDARLHGERIDASRRTASCTSRTRTTCPTAPSCSSTARRGSCSAALRRWTPGGYTERRPRPSATSR